MHVHSKKTENILQCMFACYIFSLQYTDGCICSIINDCTMACTLLWHWKMTLLDKYELFVMFLSIVIDSTFAYLNTIIYSHEDSQGTYFSLSMFNTGAMVITYHTHSNVSNSSIYVSFALLGEHCLYNSDLLISPPILGAELMISSWRQDLLSGDPSASRYGDPVIKT